MRKVLMRLPWLFCFSLNYKKHYICNLLELKFDIKNETFIA
jgi:hypothetical protein